MVSHLAHTVDFAEARGHIGVLLDCIRVVGRRKEALNFQLCLLSDLIAEHIKRVANNLPDHVNEVAVIVLIAVMACFYAAQHTVLEYVDLF